MIDSTVRSTPPELTISALALNRIANDCLRGRVFDSTDMALAAKQVLAHLRLLGIVHIVQELG